MTRCSVCSDKQYVKHHGEDGSFLGYPCPRCEARRGLRFECIRRTDGSKFYRVLDSNNHMLMAADYANDVVAWLTSTRFRMNNHVVRRALEEARENPISVEKIE